MVYVTVKQSPMYHQMTLEEFLFSQNPKSYIINDNHTNTRTYEMEDISPRLLEKTDTRALIRLLHAYNESCAELRAVQNRHDLYREFHIPKKSGGLRKIDAPNDELKAALSRLKIIFEESFGALYHTSAFAYIRDRSSITCMKRHQANESRWFGKYDLHNFFGSTTPEFVLNMLSMIYPFSEVMKCEDGRDELATALDLAFLDGGLPQGTPFSPTITNIMMIPIDYKLSNALRNFNGQRYVYTRYADDFQISSKYSFSFREVEKLISDTLASFDAPFTINASKTRYGSTSGSNWNLGVMLNKDNEITVGYKRKRRFQAMISSYIMDKKNGVEWDKNDIMHMDGLYAYYCMVEPNAIKGIVDHINQKFGVNFVRMMRDDLRL